jgi:hypothetical protein
MTKQTQGRLTDTQLLKWLHENMLWDGDRYWLPEICVRERQWGSEMCPVPTFNEFLRELDKLAKKS